jgi:hypothetical protein
MPAIAGDLDLIFRIFAALAAIFFIVCDHATARWVGTLLRFLGSHDLLL